MTDERKRHPKCKHCGKTERAGVHTMKWYAHHHGFEPAEERVMVGGYMVRAESVEPKPARLTIEVKPGAYDDYIARVFLSGCQIDARRADTEDEARAAAEAYVEELVRHFREGGR